MNKSDIVTALIEKANLTPVQAEKTLYIITEEIKNAVAKNEKVHLKDFGFFEKRKRAGRRCINPRTGEEMYVDSFYSVLFRASEEFKRRLDSGEEI